MAKVNIEYDTKSKELSCAMDGQKFDNLNDISFYPNYNSNASVDNEDETDAAKKPKKFSMRVGMHQHNKEHDTHHINQVYASLKNDGVELTQDVSDKEKVIKKISEMFSKE